MRWLVERDGEPYVIGHVDEGLDPVLHAYRSVWLCHDIEIVSEVDPALLHRAPRGGAAAFARLEYDELNLRPFGFKLLGEAASDWPVGWLDVAEDW